MDIFTGIFFYLVLKQLNARIILTQIWSKSIKRLFSCSALFLVTPNGGHLGMLNCKKSKRLYIEIFWHIVGLISISINGSWDIVIFVFMLFLVTVPDGHLGKSICLNLK